MRISSAGPKLPTIDDSVYDADETVTQSVSLDLGDHSRSIVEIAATATVATTFTLEASMDNINWFTIETFAAKTSVAGEGYINVFRYIRFGSAAAASGKVTLVIAAGDG